MSLPPIMLPPGRTGRRFLKRLGIAAIAAVLVLLAVSAYLMRDPTPRFLARRSAFESAAADSTSIDDGYALTPVRVTAANGLAVDLVMRRAVADSARRLPLVVILGGHRTGRDAAKMLGDTRGVVVAALSYPFDGNHRPKPLEFVRDIPKIRGALLDTPPAVQIALDYLLRRADVDTQHVEAVGVSLGAPFMTIAGALDQRITRVWVVHGSGGSYAPIEIGLRRSIGFAPLRAVAAGTATVLVAGPKLDPVRWAPKIAPRPFIMVSASGDERLPKAAVEALYQSAGEPKEIIWMEGQHVRPNSATIQELVSIIVKRMRAGQTLQMR